LREILTGSLCMTVQLAPRPKNEQRRVVAVKRTGLIDNNQEGNFSIFCDLGRELTGFDYAAFSLFDENFQCKISATDGSHIAIHEIDFTGQANVSVDNSGSYTWSQWRFGDPNMEIDINGNALLTTVPNGNGFDYRPTVTKFASPMITGTFGGGTGTYSGNQTITTLSVTPTDYTYDGTFLTYANWSTINSQGGQFSMVNYNSGSENDTVFTPTVTGQHGAIT